MSEFENGMLSTAEEEMDFAGDIFKPTESVWSIIDAKIDSVEDAGAVVGKQLVVELRDEEAFTRTEKFWLEHAAVEGKNWEQAVKIARGAAGELSIAVTGSPKTAASKLIGQKVLATLSKDKNGFFRLGRYKTAPREVEPVL